MLFAFKTHFSQKALCDAPFDTLPHPRRLPRQSAAYRATDSQTIKKPPVLDGDKPIWTEGFLSISLFTVLQYGKSVKTFSVEIQRIGVIQNKVLILNICEEQNFKSVIVYWFSCHSKPV